MAKRGKSDSKKSDRKQIKRDPIKEGRAILNVMSGGVDDDPTPAALRQAVRKDERSRENPGRRTLRGVTAPGWGRSDLQG